MKFYIDSTDIRNITPLLDLHFIGGVTTYPTLLRANNTNIAKVLEELKASASENVFVQIAGDNVDEMYLDYCKIRNISNELKINLVVKVPINMEGLKTIKKSRKITIHRRFLEQQFTHLSKQLFRYWLSVNL